MAIFYGNWTGYGTTVSGKSAYIDFRSFVELNVTQQVKGGGDQHVVIERTIGFQSRTVHASTTQSGFTLQGLNDSYDIDQTVSGVSVTLPKGETVTYTASTKKTYTVHLTASKQTFRASVTTSHTDATNSVADAAIELPARSKVTITFDANGGTGGPTTQQVFYGLQQVITTNAPYRANYDFDGWTSPNVENYLSDSVIPAGATVVVNQNATFTAHWTPSLHPPTISSHRACRVDSSGTESLNGDHAKFAMTFRGCRTLDANGNTIYKPVTEAGVCWGTSSLTNSTTFSISTSQTTAQSVSKWLQNTTFATGTTYKVRFYVVSEGITTYADEKLTKVGWALDLISDGVAIGSGEEAVSNELRIAFPTSMARFRGAEVKPLHDFVVCQYSVPIVDGGTIWYSVTYWASGKLEMFGRSDFSAAMTSAYNNVYIDYTAHGGKPWPRPFSSAASVMADVSVCNASQMVNASIQNYNATTSPTYWLWSFMSTSARMHYISVHGAGIGVKADNLLSNTRAPSISSSYSIATNNWDWCMLNSAQGTLVHSTVAPGFTRLQWNSTSTAPAGIVVPLKEQNSISNGTTLTLSFVYKCDPNMTAPAENIWLAGGPLNSSNSDNQGVAPTLIADGSWHVATVTWSAVVASGHNVYGIAFGLAQRSSGYLDILDCSLCLEKSSSMSGWYE